MAHSRPAVPDGYRIIDPRDPYEVAAGPFYLPESGDDFHLLLPVEARHCNASGVVHGGLLVTLADVTVCAAAIRGADDERAVTVSLTADFIAAGHEGDLLEARAEVTRRTGSLAFVRGQVAADGRILLTCSAVIKRMRRA